MADLKQKWDAIYRHREDLIPNPVEMLAQYAHLLPSQGQALDLACGLGGNAFFMAKHGLSVDAWDISDVAVERINNRTQANPVHASAVDVDNAAFPVEKYDVITVSRFLNRDIAPQLIAALKPNGLLFYQTFTLEKAIAGGVSNPKFLLKRAELLSLFASLSPIIYHEEGAIGDLKKGIRNEAILIAQKR